MKNIVGVFAHPDDEALGPSGTIAKFAKKHNVYLICVTLGEASGKTEEEKLKIGEIRRAELMQSAKILGVKEVFFLGYQDGELKNNLYHRLANDIQRHLEDLRPEVLVTFEPRGVSGHIDHIVVSLVTTYVYYKLPFIKKLMYYCISKKEREQIGEYFIYFPPGYSRDEIDAIIDVAAYWEIKKKAMYAHQSQIQDVRRVMKNKEKLPKEECFLVLNK